MTVSASTPKFYRDYAVTLRQAAMDVVDQENRAHVRSCADNCDTLAASFENAATETALQTCRQAGTVMNEIDTWRTADSLVRQFGDVAGEAVALHADILVAKNDHLGVAIWIPGDSRAAAPEAASRRVSELTDRAPGAPLNGFRRRLPQPRTVAM